MENLTGLRSGRLTAIRLIPTESPRSRSKRWRCRCDCGNEIEIIASHIRSGRRVSCGCQLQDYRSSARFAPGLVHGATSNGTPTPEYRTWCAMKSRCYTPSHSSFPRYGGKGIKVCDAWADDFPAFLRDMGAKPSPDHSIDRIDGAGDYTPENCRWAARSLQLANRRLGKHVEAFGETLSIKDAAAKFSPPDLAISAVYYRIGAGWPVEAALIEPVAVGRARNRRLPSEECSPPEG